MVFQPSLPARGATKPAIAEALGKCISTLAPREGSDVGLASVDQVPVDISTLAPREGSDNGLAVECSPRWISTLAPREGSDGGDLHLVFPPGDFNPRSPRGERRAVTTKLMSSQEFQPSLPARGATARFQAS